MNSNTMIRSLSNPPPESNHEVGVCSLSWENSPGHARLVSSLRQDDDLDVPLQHASLLSFTFSLARHDETPARQPTLNTTQICLDDTATFSKAGQKQYRMVAGRTVPLSPRTGISQRSSLCGNCEDKTAFLRSPDPPTVSPCSSASQSISDVTRSSSSSTSPEELLLAEIISRVPCIETGQSVFVSSTDIREIFFPGCSSPNCNIVVNALKLQLKYPHIPQYMHACSRGEQMTFLQRHLHLVTSGTPLVDVEAFLKHREALTAMVETKHILTSDTRSIGCSITHQQHRQQQEEHIKDCGSIEKKKMKNNVLPAIICSMMVGTEPGDCESPLEALVPLSMLPPLFPRYHRQLLLMATGFLTGKDRRSTRKCSEREARLLNIWHRHVKGSSDQLVTTADLLVKWADVAVIVDPSMKHAARVSHTHQRQQQQQLEQQQHLQVGRGASSPVRTLESPSGSRGQGTRRFAEHTVTLEMITQQTSKTDEDTDAVNWMPHILNCYSTATEARPQKESSTSPTSTERKKNVLVTSKQGTKQNVSPSLATSPKSSKETKLASSQLEIEFSAQQQNKKENQSQSSDDVSPFEKEMQNSTSSSSSAESLDDAQAIVTTLHDAGGGSNTLETTGKRIKCPSTKTKKAPPVRAKSLETVEPSTSSKKTPLPRSSSIQPKPRACKMQRKGTRHSERIARQSKGPCEDILQDPENYENQKLEAEGEEVLPRCDEGSFCKKQMPPICLTPGPNCKLCRNCGEKDTSQKGVSKEDTEESSTGLKNIANLFSVLSHEEVSHRSKKLVTDEIVESDRKSSNSKIRPLGDLTSKGLEPVSRSDILLPLPSTSAKTSSKKQRKVTKSNAVPKAGNIKSKYPDLVIEAQQCLVESTADMPKRPNSPVSVTDIMMNMDRTFHAFKNDPVELVKEKIKGCKNSTGYVNMDFIRIAHPNESLNSTKYSKPVSLPPIEKHDIGPQKKDLLTGVDISSILRTHASEKNFSILEEPTTLQDQPQSTKDVLAECAESQSVSQSGIDRDPLDPAIAGENLSGHSSSNPKDTQMKCEQAVIKPSWDIEKVVQVKGSKSSGCQGQHQDKRKQRMNAEFVAMKAKAIARSDTCHIASVNNVQQEEETSMSPITSDNKLREVELPKPVIEPLPCQSKGETNQSIVDTKQLGASSSKNGKQESTIQLKKRQRLESSSDLQHVSSQELSSNISSYWSSFPVGQRKDSLTNNSFGKSRYPIDFFKPSTPVITKRCRQKKTTVEQTCVPAQCTTIRPQAPSYTAWKKPSSLTLGHASSAENIHLQTSEVAHRERMIHSRSLSADHFPFDTNVGRKLRLPSKPFFYKDTLDNLNTSTQRAVDSALVREPRPQKDVGNNKQMQVKDVKTNDVETTSLFSSVRAPLHTHISRQDAETMSTSKGSPRTPYHEEARLLAAFNVQRLRRLSDEFLVTEETSTRRTVSESGRRDTCQIGNGQYATWNEANQMWYVDENRNRNNSNGCLPQDKDKSGNTQGADLEQGTNCPKTNATFPEETEHLPDVDELMTHMVKHFNILKKCLSKTFSHVNSNNNCNSCSDLTNQSNEYELDSGSSNVSINVDHEQSVYPGYGAMIKGEPIKRNILLRETLKENLFLIKKISLCVCTCREVLQTSRLGEEMHFKKFLKKKYLESVKHCPLHDEQRNTRHQHELSRLFQAANALHAASVHQSEMGRRKKKNKIKDRKLRIPGSVRAWFQQRQRNVDKYYPTEEKCLQLAAEEYLSTYVDQHYKKKMLARYELETRDKSDGDHLYEDFFLFMERYPHKIGKEISGAETLDGSKPQSHSDSSGKVDRELRRQLGASGSASQQELFLSILKKNQKSQKDEQSVVKMNMKCDKSSNQENQVIANLEDKDKPSISKDEPRAHSNYTCNYDEHFTNDNPDVSYHGLAYVRGVALPYVVDNGYKYVPIKMAARLLPRCCCSLVKSLLKKHPNICRTLCTWEQVGLLDSVSRRLTKTVTSTGDVLVRLDSLLVLLPQLEVELKQKHNTKRSKKTVVCLY